MIFAGHPPEPAACIAAGIGLSATIRHGICSESGCMGVIGCYIPG